jgi:ceramide glucosyltransferase
MLTAEGLVRCAGDICLALAVLGCFYLLLASIVVRRFKALQPVKAARPVPVTVLVPLCGAEPGLDSRLRALRDQDYDAPVQIVCGIQNPTDPAIRVARSVAQERPGLSVDLHVERVIHGANLKVSNLVNMVRCARHDVFILVDSDIEVGPDYLSRVVGELQKPEVDAVTCLHYGIARGGIWPRLAAMGANAHFLPNVAVAMTLGLAQPCFGATIAFSRDVLCRIGGFGAFKDQLWDDYAIGQSIRRMGREVSVPPFALGHVYSEMSARQLIDNQLRFARTIRSIDPVGFAGGVITHPFPIALLAVLLGAGERGVEVAIVALAGRLGLYWCVGQRWGVRLESPWLMPVRDVLAFALHVAAFFGASVVWRGRRYRVSRGMLLPNPE